MTDAQIFIVAGVIAIILGAVQAYRAKGQDLTDWAVMIIGLALVLVSFN